MYGNAGYVAKGLRVCPKNPNQLEEGFEKEEDLFGVWLRL